MKTKDEIVKPTVEQAIALLNESETIHTFRNPAGMMIGADWKKENVIKRINDYSDTLQLTGSMARGMRHGLALFDDSGVLFIETNEEKLNQFDPIQS